MILAGNKRKREDWSKVSDGIPSAMLVKDFATRRFLDSAIQNLRYIVLKCQDIREPSDDDSQGPDVSKRPPRVNLMPPTVTIKQPTSVTSSSATLHGAVNPNGETTTCHFDYGTTFAYGSTTSTVDIGDGISPIARNVAITGLSADTWYNVRLQGTNVNGTAFSRNVRFRTLPEGFPPAFPNPPDPDDPANRPGDDPSDLPEDDACSISIGHSSAPASLTFEMEKGGTLPDPQNWFWNVHGWWTSALTGTYVTKAAWYDRTEGTFWMWLVATCSAVFMRTVKININGKDADGNWLDAGTYHHTDGIAFTDGEASSCPITLIVREGTMSVDYTTRSLWTTVTPIHGVWEDVITLSNGTADTTIDWTAEILNEGGSNLQIDVASGSLEGVSSQQITLSLSSTPGLGVYTPTIRFTGSGTPATIDVAVNLYVVPDDPNPCPMNARITGTSTTGAWGVPNTREVNSLNITFKRTGVKSYGPADGGGAGNYIPRFYGGFRYYTTDTAGMGTDWQGPGYYAQASAQDVVKNGGQWWKKMSNVTFNPMTGCPRGVFTWAGAPGLVSRYWSWAGVYTMTVGDDVT